MTQPLGDAQRLVRESRRLLATAERSVLVDHERLHAAQIPQRALALEHLGGAQADANSVGELGVGKVVECLHVQHVGQRLAQCLLAQQVHAPGRTWP